MLYVVFYYSSLWLNSILLYDDLQLISTNWISICMRHAGSTCSVNIKFYLTRVNLLVINLEMLASVCCCNTRSYTAMTATHQSTQVLRHYIALVSASAALDDRNDPLSRSLIDSKVVLNNSSHYKHYAMRCTLLDVGYLYRFLRIQLK